MQHELAGTNSDDRLTHRASDGDLSACREIVERYGGEVFRLAFLLSGDAPRAAELTADTMIERLATLDAETEQGDLREALLFDLAARFLQQPAGAGGPAHDTRIVTFPRDAGNRRFAVDDARSRLRQALDRLTARERTFLLLRLVGSLGSRRVTELTELTDNRLDGLIERLAEAAGAASRQELSSTLVALGVEAPRVDLWELVEEPISERLAARRRRARMLTAGIVIVAVALIGGLLGSIVGNPLANSPDSGEAAAGIEDAASTSQPTEPALLPTVETAPSVTPTPAAEVDGELYVLPSRGVPELRRFTPESSRIVAPVVESDEGLTAAHEPAISPDGEHLATAWYRQDGDQLHGLVRLYDTDYSTLVWETEISTVESPGESAEPPVLLIPAVNRDVVWVAEHMWNRADPVLLRALDLSDGSLVRTVTTTMPGFVAHDVRLYAPPDLGSVHLFTITREEPPMVGQLQMVYMAYSAVGDRLYSRTLTDLVDSRIFFLYSARFTPEGEWLYGLEYTQSRRELAVHFFDLKQGGLDPKLVLPFQPLANPLPFQHATSHDGERLYILSHTTLEVGIVDLTTRRLEALVPLDVVGWTEPTMDTAYVADERMQLSPDGRYLYAIAPSTDGSSRPSGIWEIDTRRWQVERRLAPGREPRSILLAGDGRTLYVREDHPAASGGTTTFSALNLENGNLRVVAPELEGRLEMTSPAQLYKATHGRSAAVDGQVPVDQAPESTLAGIELRVSPERIAAGEHIDLEVRFIDPFSGEPATAVDALRYEPPASLQVMLEHGQSGRLVVVDLGSLGAASYGGTAQLAGDGWWAVRVVVRWPDGAPGTRLIFRPDAVRVDAPPEDVQSKSSSVSWNH